MYKLLIVDDEKFEREGMVNLIDWGKYDIQIVGSAWNGVEGYEMIKDAYPDIVLTDIRMPGMNGIELIQKVQKDFKNIFFVVLSGYGEYEYTSQAMELGVKYYVLKPCDEEKIVKVMDKVKAEILEKRQHTRYENDKYNEEIKKLFPRAKEQFFYKVLTEGSVTQNDYLIYKKSDSKEDCVRILNCQLEGDIERLRKFVLQNILEELLGDSKVIMTTYVDSAFIVLIADTDIVSIKNIIEKLKLEYRKFSKKRVRVAISDKGSFMDMKTLYEQTQKIFMLDSYQQRIDLLTSDVYSNMNKKDRLLFDYDDFKKIDDFEDLLLEVNILFAKFAIHHYTLEDIQKFQIGLLHALLKMDMEILQQDLEKKNSKETLYAYIVEKIIESKKYVLNDSKKDIRITQMLLAIYGNIDKRNLSLQWLAKEVLFMNEDYLGKLFSKSMQKKFSSFILEIRIEMAKRLIQYDPEILISDLAEVVGYTADGQYFSKVFKEYTKMKPSQYRESLIGQKQ